MYMYIHIYTCIYIYIYIYKDGKNEIRKVKNSLFELAKNYKNLDKKKKNSKENLNN